MEPSGSFPPPETPCKDHGLVVPTTGRKKLWKDTDDFICQNYQRCLRKPDKRSKGERVRVDFDALAALLPAELAASCRQQGLQDEAEGEEASSNALVQHLQNRWRRIRPQLDLVVDADKENVRRNGGDGGDDELPDTPRVRTANKAVVAATPLMAGGGNVGNAGNGRRRGAAAARAAAPVALVFGSPIGASASAALPRPSSAAAVDIDRLDSAMNSLRIEPAVPERSPAAAAAQASAPIMPPAMPVRATGSSSSGGGGGGSSSSGSSSSSSQESNSADARRPLAARIASLGVALFDPGESIGQTEVSGRGSFSDVMIGRLHRKPVCIKRLTMGHGPSTLSEEQVLAEIEALRACMSPAVITLYGCEVFDKRIHLIFELARGDLSELLYEGRLRDAKHKVSVALQMAAAVRHMHRRGFWHRDLKPHNFLEMAPMENGEPCVKLADMGKARRFALMQTVSPGTTAYMPPELLREPDASRIDAQKVDMWSLGVCLAEVAHGRLLFEHERVVTAQIADLVRAPSECIRAVHERLRIAELPRLWQIVVEHCLKYEPTQRVTSDKLVMLLTKLECGLVC